MSFFTTITPIEIQKGQFVADLEAWHGTSGDAPWISAWEAYLYGRAVERVKA
jgi:hypothetical protein